MNANSLRRALAVALLSAAPAAASPRHDGGLGRTDAAGRALLDYTRSWMRALRPPQASPQTAAALSALAGTYVGITPSDGSPIAIGEVEIVIDAAGMRQRVATGYRIESGRVAAGELQEMTAAEVAAAYAAGSPYAARSRGLKSAGGMRFIFLRDAKPDEYGLVLRGGPGDVLGPTVLFSPAQVARGDYAAFLRTVAQKMGGGKLPLLSNGGKP